MENLYAIDCGLFPKKNIINILKHNNFHFLNDIKTPGPNYSRYLSFNEDKIYFVDTAIVTDQIIIGYPFREDINHSAFEIYFPNQVIISGFNYCPEFSKSLIAMSNSCYAKKVIKS